MTKNYIGTLELADGRTLTVVVPEEDKTRLSPALLAAAGNLFIRIGPGWDINGTLVIVYREVVPTPVEVDGLVSKPDKHETWLAIISSALTTATVRLNAGNVGGALVHLQLAEQSVKQAREKFV